MPDASMPMRQGACFCCSAVSRYRMSAVVVVDRNGARGGTPLVAGVVGVAAEIRVIPYCCLWCSSRGRCRLG